MNYSKIQKLISSFLLFIFFFGQVFGLSFFSLFSNSAYAESTEFNDLVSVIVTEKVYSELSDEIERYAEDIQGYLDNTRVVILPIKDDTSAFSISSMNEKLFYEGYKGLKPGVGFESKLIGTVLIGDIELPIVEDNGKTTKSVVPFTDFEDKQFIYNSETKLFEKNNENIDGLKSEIFHGIISPNSGDSDKNIEQIKDFLDKDHDFYVGENLFDKSKEVLNGKTGEEINSKYKPYVFYFDQIREQKSLSYTEFVGYETYLKNKEDLIYHRYSQNLNQTIQDDLEKGKDLEIKKALEGVDNPDIINAFNNSKGLDSTNAPDISLKYIIDSSTNKFLEIFNKGTISDFRTNVHNAGRYNEGSSKVNVDMIPYLISILDNITDKSLKSANDDLEDYVFSKVFPEAVHVPIPVSIDSAESLPTNIALLSNFNGNNGGGFFSQIPVAFFTDSEKLEITDLIFSPANVSIKGEYQIKRGVFGAILNITEFSINGDYVEYKIESGHSVRMKISVFNKILEEYSTEYYNFYNGKPAEYLGGPDGGAGIPDFCSIYRGNTENGGQLTEQNQGFNSRKSENNSDLIDDLGGACTSSNREEITRGYWGGNSIINFDKVNGININLNYQRTDLAIENLFDPFGSQKSTDSGKNLSFLDCYNYNYLKTKKPIQFHGDKLYEVPLQLSMTEKLKAKAPSEWTCETENINFKNTAQTAFGKVYVLSSLEGMLYTIGSSDGKGKSEVAYNGNDGVNTAADCLINGIQLWYGAMGGVRTLYKASTYDGDIVCPVTRYRYDFTSTDSYIKHIEPTNDTLNLQIKNPGIPSLPIDKNRYLEIFTGDILKYEYPYLFRAELDLGQKFDIENIKEQLSDFLEEYDNKTGNILDVKNFIINKPDQTIKIGEEEKIFNYYDFLAFSVYWNNLDNVSAKYKFVMKYYLSDQVGGNNFKFILPKNKKEYEIAYLGAEGDAKNMYIKMDPEDSIDKNPYNDIYSRNGLLNSNKISVGVLNGTNKINYNVGNISALPPVNYEDGLFKCAPPEGVPIWEWIPAVMCRLEGLLPPEVSIGPGECSSSTIFESEDGVDYYQLLDEQTQNQNNSSLNGDLNKNGLNDFCENKIKDNGTLKLISDSSRYFFNSRGILRTEVLDKDNKRIMLDNSSNITFKLKKIVDKSTGEIIFDNYKDDFEDKKQEIGKYISFKEFESKSRYGESKYSFATKNKTADIYFESSLDLRDSQNHSVKKISSNIVLIKIRSERLFVSSKKILNNKIYFERSIKVSDKTNLYIYDEKNTNLNIDNFNDNSVALGILNIGTDSKKSNINFPLNITLRDKNNKIVRKETLNNLNKVKELFTIKKSGSYKIEIIDKYDFKVKVKIEALALNPSKIKLDTGTNILESGNSVSTNLISIYDKFDNIVLGDKYQFELNILGNSLEFEGGLKKLKLSTYEGYKAFRTKSKDETGISKIVIDLYKDNKKLLTTSKNIKVLKELKLNIKYNNILKVGNNEYEAELEFLDKNNKLLSDLNSRVYMSAGSEYIKLSSAYNAIINGKSLIKFKTKTLAGEDKTLSFRVEGFNTIIDKNITIFPEKAFGLSFVNTKTKLEANINNESYINIELRDIYNNLVFTDNNSVISLELLNNYKKLLKVNNLEKTLHKGKVSFKINTTDFPGKTYLKFSINKDLEENEFIVGEGEKQIIMHGVSNNALMIETYFFYNKKSIEGSKYNSLYTTLLGAEYGDITQKDYLAGSMIFDKKNRSLAVTSLLNSPYNKLDVLKISSEGIITKSYDRTDLTQDVTFTLKKDLNNKKYYLDLFNSALNTYIGKIYLNFNDLNIDSKIISKIENSKILDIKKLLNIEELEVYSASNKIKLNSLIENKQNSLIIYTGNGDYKIRDLYFKNGNSKSIYYIDPFNTKFSLNSFSRYSLDSYDNFEKNKKVGWSAGNKSLLAFSAGESVGDSTKQYMGVSGINLGDPIISLKKIKKKSYGIYKKFDSSIGKKLNKNEIQTYRVFDFNADNLDDILFVEKNGLFSLLENTETSKGFLNQKHLARVVDIGNFNFVSTGDFSGDKYEDIFFVNKKGEPFLLNNNLKDFKRIDLRKNFDLKGKIIQAKSFDMDNDSIDDIVTLDDAGEINIFYGKNGTTDFTKKNIYSGYGMKLNSGIRNNMGVVYFDGLTQGIQNRTTPQTSTGSRNVDILENLMFEKIAYDPDVDILKQNYTKNTTFIKSEFASEVGVIVEKNYKDINGGDLITGDIIEVEIKIKNNTKGRLNNIVYAEDIPNYFNLITDSIQIDSNDDIGGELGYYKFYINKFTLSSNGELIIKYKVKTKALAYGNIKVGLFEQGEAGDDEYGDILLSSSKYNCGGNSDIFRSTNKRSYIKGLRKQSCDESKLPEELAKNDIDEDGNGIPDYIDNLVPENIDEPTESEISNVQEYSNSAIETYGEDNKINEDSNIYNNIELINQKVDDLSSDIDNLIDGFGCGFGGGSCFAMPINWAPLAPGNDISTPFGLIGDGLRISEGVPIFSNLTGLQTSKGCFPTVWPISPLAYIPGPTCGLPSAGGYLGTWSPTNTFRLFVTPTLTGGIGTAACFGGPASAAGNIPPILVTPFIPFGNCVVAAAPFPGLCEDEEINSDPSSIGQVDYIGSNFGGNGDSSGNGYGVINGNCSAGSDRKKLPISNKIDTNLASAYLKYRESGIQNTSLVGLIDDKFGNIEDREIDYDSSLLQNEPLISIGGSDIDNADISVSLDFSDDGSSLNFNAVEQLRMERIAPFPRFITQWVNDQLEEFITKLVDFPTFFIILPDFSKIFDTDWGDYADSLVSGTKKSYQTGGIKEAYEFLGNVPFVTIEGEAVNINIPELDPEYYHSIITQRKLVLQSYPEQIEEAIKSGRYSPESIISAQAFVKSLEMNLGILETYKDIPGAISRLFNKKQEYLEQIMCNIESIENVTGGWLGFNGKRFKAWVELYILIKAILKSWQLLVDIFQDYDEACHECKNERWDSTQWEWTLISMILPPIPVIQFPKWPDITLDIHNIRMNLAVKLPEFKVNYRPLVLPPAPLLLLPDYNYKIPPLPILPLLEIPELPDIPSIPTVKLPDLPPPPTLPKIWSSIESFLNILKLIVKAMCILKKVPLVPEHRAGDQIAFLTEGNGYRGFDFIDKLLPNFSYPYLDEIKVTSYVNLEFETDFITEMARTIVSPINDMTNDFSHMFDNNSIEDVDLTNYGKTSYKGENVDSKEFISLVNRELSKDYLLKYPEFNELRHSFDVVNNYTYSKENKLITDLQRTNYEKFDILKSIIKREIKKTKKLKNDSKEIFNNYNLFRTIGNTDTDDIKIYNKSLKKYNDAFKKSAKNLIKPNYFDTDSLKETGKNILNDVKTTTDNFEELVQIKNKNTFGKNNSILQSNTNKTNNLLAQNTKKYLSANITSSTTGGTCSSQKKSKYSRNYKGIYIIQKKGSTKISYKLFDYLDDLNGDEVTTEIDFDLDGDLDLLYSVNGDLYIKENLVNKKNNKNYLSGVEILNISDNSFMNGNINYEAVNGLNESYVSNSYINVNFASSNRKNISNYRFEYYSIIDKYLNEKNDLYIPHNINKNIVDSFSDIDNTTISKTGTGYIIRNNLAYIYEVGNNIAGVKFKTKELLNIKESLKNGKIAIIPANTQIYSGGNNVEISYQIGDNKNIVTTEILNHTNIEFDDSIKINSISGNAYILGAKEIILKGNEIYNYLDLPIFPESSLYVSYNFNKNNSSHIGIKYYDSSENNLDFRKVNSYLIYNLGTYSNSYSINLNTANDYFYSKIGIFKNNIFGTKTSQVLLSPQLESDRDAPELDINSKIRIPVYQNKIIDLTNSLYENSGLDNIFEFKIEGIEEDKYEILRTENKFRIRFGKFNKIFSKKIKFIISDNNNNTLKKDILFEVYPPVPEINSYNLDTIKGVINEELNGEPINLYRFRGGNIKRLESNSGTTRVDTINGRFDFNLSTINSDLVDIKFNNNNIFNVNENTGKINLLNPLYNIKAKINDNNFIEISVLDNNVEEIFSEIIKFQASNSNINIVDSFIGLEDNGLYLKLINDDFDYYKIPDSAKINPGSVAIYRKTDTGKEALFAILRDGRIKTINNFYNIKYSTFDNYIIIKLIDKNFNKEVGQLLLRLNSSYVIK